MAQRKILMGRDNPDGMKLEDLLAQLRDEVQEKSNLIRNSEHPQRDMILRHNAIICTKLQEAELFQRETYRQLDAVAPNEGPLKPRL
jgi:hypothetical protein